MSALRLSLLAFLSTGIGLEKIQQEDDLFAAGLDSLQAMNTVKRINAAAESQGLQNFKLPPDAIYANRNIAELTSTIMSLIKLGEEGIDNEKEQEVEAKAFAHEN